MSMGLTSPNPHRKAVPMGYMHAWQFDPTHPQWRAGFPDLEADAARIIQEANLQLGGSRPLVAQGWIGFNGGTDGAYDPFLLTFDPRYCADPIKANGQRGGWWRSDCKTNRNPYDLVVCAILLRATHHFPDCFTVSSDGGWDDECTARWPGRRSRGRVRRNWASARGPWLPPCSAPTKCPPPTRCARHRAWHRPPGGAEVRSDHVA